MSYYIAGNRCDCHPETCCCVDYALYKIGLIDTKIAVSDYRDHLEKLEYQYNLNESLKQEVINLERQLNDLLYNN